MSELISVIVPVYNTEKYIRKCIESLLNQTYKRLEIILVDDGSQDRSGEICDEYKSIDERITVIHKKNGGLSDARNVGIKIAKGEYIAFLDSDDWVDINLYSRLYSILKKYSAEISICNFKKVFDEDDILSSSEKIYNYSNIEALEEIYGENCAQMIVAWNKLYKKNIFRGLYYPKGKIHEDEFLTPKLLYRANKIVYIEEELIYYRQTPNSIMNSEFSIRRLDYLEILEERNEFIQNNGLTSIEIKSIERQLNSIINYYFKVKSSRIHNKENVSKDLYNKFIKTSNNIPKKLLFKFKLKIFIFKLSPRICKYLFISLEMQKIIGNRKRKFHDKKSC
ncbi:glycosyltransferase family 2 protein [Clostridium nigeriense]|uniref:glycosyltransferase family 2 protein n=1 Tax=Clostridium nigeriense TaxID=1805470 RepID=UPI003D350C91